MGSRTRGLRRCCRRRCHGSGTRDQPPLQPFVLPPRSWPKPRPAPLQAPPLTSWLLASPGPPLSLTGKQDLEGGHLSLEAVACTGGEFPGEFGVWGPDFGGARFLDFWGAGMGRGGPGGAELQGADRFGSCVAPPPHMVGSKGPTGPKDPRRHQGPGLPQGVLEERVQTTPM